MSMFTLSEDTMKKNNAAWEERLAFGDRMRLRQAMADQGAIGRNRLPDYSEAGLAMPGTRVIAPPPKQAVSTAPAPAPQSDTPPPEWGLKAPTGDDPFMFGYLDKDGHMSVGGGYRQIQRNPKNRYAPTTLAPMPASMLPERTITGSPASAHVPVKPTIKSIGVVNDRIQRIAQIESSNNPNAKNPTSSSSGRMGVLDSTAADPGYGITPAADMSIEEKDRVGYALVKHYTQLFPNDPARFALAYHNGLGVAQRWDGTKDGLKAAITIPGRKTTDQDVKNAWSYIQKFMAGEPGVQTVPTDTVPRPDLPLLETQNTSTSSDIIVGSDEAQRDNRGRTRPVDPIQGAGISTGANSIVENAKRSNPPEPAYVPPAMVNKELNMARTQLQTLDNLLGLYAKSRNWAQYNQTLEQANNLVAAATYLGQQKAVDRFEAGDPRLLAKVFSNRNEGEWQIIPRTDGLWDIEVDGELRNEGVSTSQITSGARYAMSSEYAQGIRSAAAEKQAAADAALWEHATEVEKKHIDRLTEIQKAEIAANKPVIVGDMVFKKVGPDRYAFMRVDEYESKLTGEPVEYTKVIPSTPFTSNLSEFKTN